MADATIAKNATDIFALGGNFRAQSSSTDNEDNQTVPVHDADGDVSCETAAFGDKLSVTSELKYCGSALGTDLPAIGSVSGGYVIESIAIATSATETPTISISGHNHTANAHATGLASYDWPAAIIAELDAIVGKKGAVDFFDNDGASVATQSSTITGSCQHIDTEDSDGDHLAGDNYEGKIEVTQEFVGIVSAITDAAFQIDSNSGSDGNTELDTSSITGHIYLTRA